MRVKISLLWSYFCPMQQVWISLLLVDSYLQHVTKYPRLHQEEVLRSFIVLHHNHSSIFITRPRGLRFHFITYLEPQNSGNRYMWLQVDSDRKGSGAQKEKRSTKGRGHSLTCVPPAHIRISV
jgi:hypothetical protein